MPEQPQDARSAASTLDSEARERVRRLRGLQRDAEGNDDYLAGIFGADANLIEHLRFALEQANKNQRTGRIIHGDA